MSGHARWEAMFSRGLFDSLSPPAPRGVHFPSEWPRNHASDEDKLVVICRCLQRVGFTLGQFLAALFADVPHSDHLEISNMLSYFLHGRAPASERPLAIVKLIFRHKGTRHTGGLIPPLEFHVPQYALPPSQRLKPHIYQPYLTQHNAIMDWAVDLTRRQVDKEAQKLVGPTSVLRRSKSIAAVTWDLLRTWDMTRVQESIAIDAPVLFSIMTTAATSTTARNHCEQAAKPLEDGMPMDDGPELEGNDDDNSDSERLASESEEETSTPNNEEVPGRSPSASAAGVPAGMMRDSWQVRPS